MDAHPSSEVAEELVVLRFFGGDADAEGGVREAFLYHAYKFDHVLGHQEEAGNKAGRIYIQNCVPASPKPPSKTSETKNCVAKSLK